MSWVQLSLFDRQCLTWLHSVLHASTTSQHFSQAKGCLWPLTLPCYSGVTPPTETSHRTLPATGGEATEPISVMFFPKYFTKALAIPCTTAQLLILVWSRTIQVHGDGRPGKTLLRPQSTQQSISPCTLPGDVKLHWSIVPEQLYPLTSRKLTKTPWRSTAWLPHPQAYIFTKKLSQPHILAGNMDKLLSTRQTFHVCV